jgi:hypothetical protein
MRTTPAARTTKPSRTATDNPAIPGAISAKIPRMIEITPRMVMCLPPDRTDSIKWFMVFCFQISERAPWNAVT